MNESQFASSTFALAKCSWSNQRNTSDKPAPWNHVTNKNLVAVLGSTNTSDGTILQVMKGAKILDTLKIEQLSRATENAIASAKTHNFKLLTTQYPLVVIHQSPCFQFKYKTVEESKRIQLRLQSESDCEQFLSILGQLKCVLLTQSQITEPHSSQRSSSPMKEPRPSTSSSITLGRPPGQASSSPERPVSIPESDAYYSAASRLPSHQPTFSVADPSYSTTHHQRPPIFGDPTRYRASGHNFELTRPQTSLPAYAWPVRQSDPVHFTTNTVTRPASHGGFSTLPQHRDRPAVPLWHAQECRDDQVPSAVQRQLQRGNQTHGFLEPIPSPVVASLTALADGISPYLPPRRILPFETRTSTETVSSGVDRPRPSSSSLHSPPPSKPAVIQGSQPSHAAERLLSSMDRPRPLSSSLELPPLPKPTLARPTHPSSAVDYSILENAESFNPIRSAVTAPHSRALVSEDSQPVKRPTTGDRSDREPEKRTRPDNETSSMPLRAAHGNAQRTVPASTDLDILKAYADQPDDVRQAALNDLICQYLHDDSFLKLCEDLDNNWRRIGLEPPR